jgi:hypothetical protein
LNGCLTATLPKRGNDNGYLKTFFADAPIEIKKYVPQEILDNCEFVTQQAYFSDDELKDTKCMFEYIKKHYGSRDIQLDRYIEIKNTTIDENNKTVNNYYLYIQYKGKASDIDVEKEIVDIKRELEDNKKKDNDE